MRSRWARTTAAGVIAVVAALIWIWGFGYFRDELQLEFLAWPVGIGVAIGAYLLIGYVYRQFGPKATPMHLSGGALIGRAEAQLARLQPVTHFVHALGDPWPKAVCGTNGVYIIDPRPAPGHVGFLDGEIRIDGREAPAEWIGEVRRLVDVVGHLLAEGRGIEIDVLGVVVVDEATIVPAALKAGSVEIAVLPVNELEEHVTFGRAVTIETARAAHEALRAWRPNR